MSSPAKPAKKTASKVRWVIYVLYSARRNRTYVGIAVDLPRRLRQHNGDVAGGAKSTRAGRPWTLARTIGPVRDRSVAQQLEATLKRARGEQRLTVKIVVPRVGKKAVTRA